MTTLQTNSERRSYEKKPKKNLELRAAIISEGLEYQEVANEIGIHKTALSHWLEEDLTERKERLIRAAVKTLKERA